MTKIILTVFTAIFIYKQQPFIVPKTTKELIEETLCDTSIQVNKSKY